MSFQRIIERTTVEYIDVGERQYGRGARLSRAGRGRLRRDENNGPYQNRPFQNRSYQNRSYQRRQYGPREQQNYPSQGDIPPTHHMPTQQHIPPSQCYPAPQPVSRALQLIQALLLAQEMMWQHLHNQFYGLQQQQSQTTPFAPFFCVHAPYMPHTSAPEAQTTRNDGFNI